ncbi:MAG: RagB/SusD family nutrient uptake outer membrane protein [Chitinophagaceae bacterium]
MKNFQYLIFLLLLTVGLGSCKKDFLNGQPYSTTSTENFYKSASDMEQALTGCYAILNSGYTQEKSGGIFYTQFPTLGTAGTDEMVTRDNQSEPSYSPIGYGAWNSQSIFTQDAWSFLYIGINRCNLLLEKLPAVSMDAGRKSQIVAEARFLRGLEYMYLGMMFGGAPVVTVSNPAQNLARNTAQELFTQVFSDLEYARTNLNTTSPSLGRANKYAAAGLLAKAYEFVGSCKLNNVGTGSTFPLNDFSWANSATMYSNALMLTTEIVNSNKYVLIPRYDYLFRETTKSFQYQEFLFNTESSSDPANGNQPTYQATLIPLGNNAAVGGGTSRIVPTGELFAKYTSAVSGIVYTDYRKSWNFSGQIPAANPLYETIEGIGYYVPAALAIPRAPLSPNNTVATKVFYCSKFRYRDPKLKKIILNNTDGNFPILRYAEILLMHAEAIYYTSGNVASARTYLSQIRKRAITTTLTLPADITAALATLNTAYTNNDFVQELLDERARELCFEGSRHFDLTRLGRYASVVSSLTSDRSLGFNNTAVALLKTNFTPNKIWFPLPYQQLLVEPALVQNPGY